MCHLCYNRDMYQLSGANLRKLMDEQDLSFTELMDRLHETEGNEALARSTVSRLLNDRYPYPVGANIVIGLAHVLDASTDYLYGLSNERRPDELAFARKYELVSEDALLTWLSRQNAELAAIMRVVRDMPEKEQQTILDHLAREIRFIRRMVSKQGEAAGMLAAADGEQPVGERKPAGELEAVSAFERSTETEPEPVRVYKSRRGRPPKGSSRP